LCPSALGKRLGRKKIILDSDATKLDRCLTTFDLTALGIGATLGVGIYVLSGKVSKDLAGPSVVLSFIIAGFASALSGLCYAEMGSRVPKAGSAYVYSYVTMGEGVSLVIGWNLILEYAIGTASVARAYSGYLDNLTGNRIYQTFRLAFPLDIPHLSPFPDFCAFGITILLAVLLSVGVNLSTKINNIFTTLNLCIVVLVTLLGLSKADKENWGIQGGDSLTYNITTEDGSSGTVGLGGFFPFGVSGTLAGAATCFYGFVGFDSIATSGEETINPQRAIPLSILISLAVVCAAYIGVSSSLTLMTPFYLQDVTAPLPAAFRASGMEWVATVVAVGALVGLSTSLLGAMFPLPRIIYAMASDGILFRWLSKVNGTLKTPVFATAASGLTVATLSAMLELESLVEMMSIGTLLAYSMVSYCVLVLRYETSGGQLGDYLAMSDLNTEKQRLNPAGPSSLSTEDEGIGGEDSDDEIVYCHKDDMELIGQRRKAKMERMNGNGRVSYKTFLVQMFNLPGLQTPTTASSHVARSMALMTAKFAVSLAMVIALGIEKGHAFSDETGSLKGAWMFPLVFMPSMICLGMISISLQPVSDEALNFRVPLVPLLPVASIFINSYLMMKLSYITWVRFGVWMFLGLLVYATYGWHNSSEEYRQKGVTPPNEISSTKRKFNPQ